MTWHGTARPPPPPQAPRPPAQHLPPLLSNTAPPPPLPPGPLLKAVLMGGAAAMSGTVSVDTFVGTINMPLEPPPSYRSGPLLPPRPFVGATATPLIQVRAATSRPQLRKAFQSNHDDMTSDLTNSVGTINRPLQPHPSYKAGRHGCGCGSYCLPDFSSSINMHAATAPPPLMPWRSGCGSYSFPGSLPHGTLGAAPAAASATATATLGMGLSLMATCTCYPCCCYCHCYCHTWCGAKP